MKIKVKLDPGAYMPEYAHDADAGADLRTPFDVTVYYGESAKVDTGVHLEIPEGYVGFLKSKSGLNVNYGILNEGVIDSGYTGSIVVKLYNHSFRTHVFKAGDKIAQLVILPFLHADFKKVDKLKKTKRGDNGFGSTGR